MSFFGAVGAGLPFTASLVKLDLYIDREKPSKNSDEKLFGILLCRRFT